MYLEIDEGFDSHRKTLAFCRLMQNPEAGIYLIRLWTWACRSASDGDLRGMEGFDIESAVRYRALDGKLCAAMVKAGFIDVDPETSALVKIHNWESRTGSSVKRLEDDAARKRRHRSHRNGECGGATRGCELCLRITPVTHPVLRGGADCPEDVRRTSAGQSVDGPQDGGRKSSTDQSSPVQSSPDRREEIPTRARAIPVPPRTGPARAPEPEVSSSGGSEPGPDHQDPTTVQGLLHALRVHSEREYPERGFWQPGRFAEKTAEEFLRRITPERRDDYRRDIPGKVVAFFNLDDKVSREKAWSLAHFVDRYGSLKSITGIEKRKFFRAPTTGWVEGKEEAS